MSLKDVYNIEGKTVLLTGASGFFGRHIARAFLSVGADLVLMSRNRRLLDQVDVYRTDFPKRKVDSYIVDFYNLDDMKESLYDIVHTYDISCLVNNAYDVSQVTGFNVPDGRLDKSRYEHWYCAFSCLYWCVLTTQYMRDQKNCSIINVASMYANISPNPNMYRGTGLNPPTYSAVKAALCALTRYTASFWGHRGIRCNAILPGAFPNLEYDGPNAPDKLLLKNLRKKERTALGRLGHPRELVGLLIFLACDASSYVTGQSIVIDGGWTIT